MCLSNEISAMEIQYYTIAHIRTLMCSHYRPVCNRRSFSEPQHKVDWNGWMNASSKLSSWLPAITSLCRWGNCPTKPQLKINHVSMLIDQRNDSPIHALNSITSSFRPHFVKSPAWIKISPGKHRNSHHQSQSTSSMEELQSCARRHSHMNQCI